MNSAGLDLGRMQVEWPWTDIAANTHETRLRYRETSEPLSAAMAATPQKQRWLSIVHRRFWLAP